jgi:hypothetical protein
VHPFAQTLSAPAMDPTPTDRSDSPVEPDLHGSAPAPSTFILLTVEEAPIHRPRSSTDPMRTVAPVALFGPQVSSNISRSRSKSAIATGSIRRINPATIDQSRPLSNDQAAPSDQIMTSFPSDLPSSSQLFAVNKTSDAIAITDASLFTQKAYPRQRGGSDKVMQFFGDREARNFVAAKEKQARSPWFLRPSYVEGKDIKLDFDGGVKAGSMNALVEQLMVDPLSKGSTSFGYQTLALIILISTDNGEDIPPYVPNNIQGFCYQRRPVRSSACALPRRRSRFPNRRGSAEMARS